MKQSILHLNNEEAYKYFLEASRFCNIDLPSYFDFQVLLTKLSEKIEGRKLSDIEKGNLKPNDQNNVNYKFLTNKDGNFAWRQLQIVNPAIYVCLVNRITESNNWNLIQNRFAYFQENKRIRCYSLPLLIEQDDNQLKKDQSANIRNWWEEMEQQSIELALQYKYVLITDITDCYGSIYTHSIGWALHGKEEARKERNNQSPTLIGCIIDKLILSMSYRQTNGIPQGSTLMDFISEMVLGYADSEFTKKVKAYNVKIDYQILRYRDDYKIFANTQEDAVVIAKILSEVLAELNLKFNSQKTYVSNNVIRDVIKPDKLYWNELILETKTLEKQLLLIHSLSEKYPNSGSIATSLNKFMDGLNPISIYREGAILPLISILVDIAYNNPRTYSLVIVCLGILLSLEPDKDRVNNIYNMISKKFESKPNTGYWNVWFQRLIIKENRGACIDSNEKLCLIAANKQNVQLWNISWLKDEYQQIFNEYSIFDDQKFEKLPSSPEKNEARLFVY